jgi:hypothetical protein
VIDRTTVDVRPLAAVYEATRTRIAGVVRDLVSHGRDPVSVQLSACPSWSVHDVVAHMAGGCADILAGNVQGAATDAWTAAQVDGRRGATVEALLAEWDDVGRQVAAIVDDFPGRYGSMAIGDLAVHEHDIRGAVRRPGARDSLAVALATDFLFAGIVQPGATALGLAPLEVRAGDWSWIVGTGGPPSGDPEPAIAAALLSEDGPSTSNADPVGHVAADPFELFRAITGRRSPSQIRRFEWTVDPEPYLALFGLWPFTIRETDLVE